MYQKVLVEALIQDGQRLVDALEHRRFPMIAAVWYGHPETYWMLAIVSTAVDRTGPLVGYQRIQRALQSVKPEKLDLTDITLISPRSQEFENIRSLVSAPKRSGRPVASGDMRSVALADAYVYRM